MPFKTDFGGNTQNKQKKSKLGHPIVLVSWMKVSECVQQTLKTSEGLKQTRLSVGRFMWGQCRAPPAGRQAPGKPELSIHALQYTVGQYSPENSTPLV